ncbi:hypothetical protein WN943_014823 [Citrus x changshan-huyou]
MYGVSLFIIPVLWLVRVKVTFALSNRINNVLMQSRILPSSNGKE